MSADPSGAGGGAPPAGGAVLPQQSPARLTDDGRFPRPAEGALRDQHGGPAAGRRGAGSASVLLPEAPLPHALRRRPPVRLQTRSLDAHHRFSPGSQGLRRGLVSPQITIQDSHPGQKPDHRFGHRSQRL